MKIEVDEKDLGMLYCTYQKSIEYGLTEISYAAIGNTNGGYFPEPQLFTLDEKLAKIKDIIIKLETIQEKQKNILALKEIANADKIGRFTHKDMIDT